MGGDGPILFEVAVELRSHGTRCCEEALVRVCKRAEVPGRIYCKGGLGLNLE